MGGETSKHSRRDAWIRGPSPRGRGNLTRYALTRTGSGSIPAWAGKPISAPASSIVTAVHPRVGGETYYVVQDAAFYKGPSPRGRGNQATTGRRRLRQRSIPAWAGKPRPRPLLRAWKRVHPRVGGETAVIVGAGEMSRGPSPRGRGNPWLRAPYALIQRSIPAWAGKPR